MTSVNHTHARGRRNRAAATLGVIALLTVGGWWLGAPESPPVKIVQAGPQSAGRQTGRYPFKVVEPGPGKVAPPIRLTTTAGTRFDLAALRGRTVLVYFQEGLMCDACWEQLKAIEANFQQFHLIGIDTMVTITTDPPDLLAEKVRSDGYATPVAADPSVAVSRAYHANTDSMMGGNRYDAHTFLVVGPDGLIRWRADYGGAPDYTMFVPVPALIADIMRGLAASRPGGAA